MKKLLLASLILASCNQSTSKLDKEIEESEQREQQYQQQIDSNEAEYNKRMDSLYAKEMKKF